MEVSSKSDVNANAITSHSDSKRPNEELNRQAMKISDVILILLGIGLLSSDTISDVTFGFRLLVPTCNVDRGTSFVMYGACICHQNVTIENMTMVCSSIPDEMLDESQQQATCDDTFDIWSQLSEEEHNMKCQDIGRFYNHPTFSVIVFCPIILCTLFTMYQWRRVETNWKTFPLLLSQCWPLYRLFRLLYLGLWKKEDKKWIEEYDDFKRNVQSLGT